MATCKTKKAWNEVSLVKVLKDLQGNKHTMRAAAKGIPCSTIYTTCEVPGREEDAEDQGSTGKRGKESRKRSKEKQREDEKQQKAATKAIQKHQKQKTASRSRVTDQQQKASHTSDSTVYPVCDGVCEEEGECIGCEECMVPPALVY